MGKKKIPPSDIDKVLATMLSIMREQQGWTEAELAERANNTQPTIHRLLTGKRAFYLKDVVGIASAFNLTASRLIEQAEQQAEWQLNNTPYIDPEALDLAAYEYDPNDINTGE